MHRDWRWLFFSMTLLAGCGREPRTEARVQEVFASPKPAPARMSIKSQGGPSPSPSPSVNREAKGQTIDASELQRRLMELSERGALPRRLSSEDAERLVEEWGRLGQLRKDPSADPSAVESAAASLTDECLKLAGVSCGELFYEPHALPAQRGAR